MNNTKTYLGDSVYAEVVDGMIKLTTENGFGPSNTIYLELVVYDALVNWVNRIQADARAAQAQSAAQLNVPTGN